MKHERGNMKEEILKLIESIKEDYDKNSQRAELLIRNKKFLQDFKSIIKDLPDAFLSLKDFPKKVLTRKYKNNILIKLRYTQYRHKYWIEKQNRAIEDRAKEWGVDKIENEIQWRFHLFEEDLEWWKSFCDTWSIDYEWDSKLESLNRYIRNPVEIYCIESPPNNFKNKEDWAFFLRFNAWTTKEDINDKWQLVEWIQRNILGKYERKANFSRDLRWYDLYKKGNMTPKEIAELWIKKYPEDIDLLVIRKIKKDIKEAINKDERLKEFRRQELDDNELLKEIKSGKLMKKVEDYYDFNYEREDYASGKYPPFIDVIKKAIKRMENQIRQVYSQPEEHEYLGIKKVIEKENKLIFNDF